jgi:PRC-barrel domain
MSTFPDDAELAGGAPNLTGSAVLDDHHEKVGTVRDVVYDDDGEPRWAVVDPGPLRSAHFVPIEGSYMTASGEMVLPYAKEQVKRAPKAPRDHILDSRTESQLELHYELPHRN